MHSTSQFTPQDLLALRRGTYEPPAPQGGPAAPLGGPILLSPSPSGVGEWGDGVFRSSDPGPQNQEFDPAPSYPDHIGTLGGSLRPVDVADWVPHVQARYGLFVVGTGRIKDDRCGRFKPLDGDVAGACQNEPNNHKPFLLPIGCSRRECPEDWSRWAHKGSRRAGNVVNGYLNAKFKDQALLIPGFVPRYLPDHISVHPPRRVVLDLVKRTEKALVKKGIPLVGYEAGGVFHKIFQKKYNEAEQRILASVGIRSYASVYHPVRLRRWQDEEKADVIQDTQRYRRVLDRKDWGTGIKFSVHSHVITDGSYLLNASDFCGKTGGWTYRNHGEISNLESLVLYLLSHAGSVPGRESIRYLGEFHNMTCQGIIKAEYFPVCPECQQEGKHDPCQCNYTVASLLVTEYGKDRNGHRILVDWEWGQISHKFIRRSRVIPVFRLNPLGERRRPMKRTEDGKKISITPKDFWDTLLPDIQEVNRWQKVYSAEEFALLPDSEKPMAWV